MTIGIKDLTSGEWYTGFMWQGNRQIGALDMRWHTADGWLEGYFYNIDWERVSHRDADSSIGSKHYTFEPSVVCIGEPAS